jgi:hypothetical protein
MYAGEIGKEFFFFFVSANVIEADPDSESEPGN